MRDFNADLQELVDTAAENWVAPQERKDAYRSEVHVMVETVRSAARSYDDLYALLKNPKAEIETRRAASSVARSLWSRDNNQRQTPKRIDKRRAISALITALNTDDFELRRTAIDTLGMMKAKQAYDLIYETAVDDSVGAGIGGLRGEAITALGQIGDNRAMPLLVKIAQDKTADETMRIAAILGLEALRDQAAVPALIAIMVDKSDSPIVRGEAAEWLSGFYAQESVWAYIAALQDESDDVRFWAAYGLEVMDHAVDISDALPVLDHTFAFDDSLPKQWWQVGREALAPLGGLWHRMRDFHTAEEDYWSHTSLISPLLEYVDFQRASWQQEGEEAHRKPFEQTTSLQVDPAWLREQLKSKWEKPRFDGIEPKPESLLLNWEIDMPNGLLLGGLHRDGYSIMLTSRKAMDVAAFAVWYRGIISQEHRLRIYRWADFGYEILPTMTAQALYDAGRFMKAGDEEES